jgi:hypothetical protein
MKTRFITSAAVTLAGLGILMAADVKTDYDHAADFGAYRTYSWLRVEAGDSLWSDRIRQAVSEQLGTKGLTPQESGGDLSIAAMGRTREEQSYSTFYNGIGGGWFWRGFGGPGMATTTVQETPVGTLTVDMFDAKTKKLVWRGTSTESLSNKPDKNTKKLDEAVANMFKKFPPKGES